MISRNFVLFCLVEFESKCLEVASFFSPDNSLSQWKAHFGRIYTRRDCWFSSLVLIKGGFYRFYLIPVRFFIESGLKCTNMRDVCNSCPNQYPEISKAIIEVLYLSNSIILKITLNSVAAVLKLVYFVLDAILQFENSTAGLLTLSLPWEKQFLIKNPLWIKLCFFPFLEAFFW